MSALAIIAALASSVPSIAKMIGMSDNATKVAEVASSVLNQVTGKTGDEALGALRANPELMLQYQVAMLAKEQEFESLYVSDKHSARLRDTEITKAGKRNYRADFLVFFSGVLLVGILAVVTLTELNEYAKGMFTMLAGFITNQLANVFSFEFGTTRKEEDTNKSIIQDYIRTPSSKE